MVLLTVMVINPDTSINLQGRQSVTDLMVSICTVLSRIIRNTSRSVNRDFEPYLHLVLKKQYKFSR
jgi:hypothetical protein